MSDQSATPLRFRTLDDDDAAHKPAWMTVALQTVVSAPFVRTGAGGCENDQRAGNDRSAPSNTPPRRNSVLPSAPQEHTPLASGGLRPSVIALAPAQAAPAEPVCEAAAAKEIAAEKRAFTEALLEIATLRARALREAEQSLTDLSVRVAQAIVERELEGDPALHLNLVRATLAAFGDLNRSTLRASPKTYDAILEVHCSAVVEFNGVQVTITRDPSLLGLGCIVEGEVNLVDGRVEERLAAVWRAFRADNQRAQEEPR